MRVLIAGCRNIWIGNMKTTVGFLKLLFSGRRDEISPDMMGEAVIENTAIADYVWLPSLFDGDRPYIKWMDTWSLDDFA